MYAGRLFGQASIEDVGDGAALRTKPQSYVVTHFGEHLERWSVATWVRSPSKPQDKQVGPVVSAESILTINWDHTQAAFRGAAQVQAEGKWHAASFGPLEADTWYYLVATYDGQTLRAYTNGKLVTANEAPSGPSDESDVALAIGVHPGGQGQFTGQIRQVRVYDRALTEEEVAGLAKP
jgi:hypothetical protein